MAIMRGAAAKAFGCAAALCSVAAIGLKVAADGGGPTPFVPPTPVNPMPTPQPTPRTVPGPKATSTSRPVPFKRPYEIWERYKDRFGFISAIEAPVQTPAERAKALYDKRKELQKEYQNSRDAEEKQRLKKQLEDIEKDIAMASLAPRGKTAEEQRAAFVEDLVDALVLCMGGDDQGALPDFQCSRNTVLEDLEKILKEIGKEAAPGIWKMLSEQVRFRTQDGPARKAELEGRATEIRARIKELDEGPKPKDADERHKLAMQRQNMEDQIDGLERACKVVQRAVGGTNQKVIEKLEELLLGVGPDAVPTLSAGACEMNPAAVQEATGLILRLGAKAVAPLIEGLKNEKTFRASARILKQLTRQDFGDDAKAWAEWYEKEFKAKEPKK